MEKWIKINNDYEVSNMGRVRSLDKRFIRKDGIKSLRHGKVLKPNISTTGYLYVAIYTDEIPKTPKIHRLVAKAFIPNPNNFDIVNHKNGIKTDNRVENLEWCNQSFNVQHALKLGLIKPLREGESGMAKKVANIETGKVYDSVSQLVRTENTCSPTRLYGKLNGRLRNNTPYRYV